MAVLNFIRNLVLGLAGLTCFVGPALSGDTANRFIFGFSENARWFAFEEFGVQDGSGFPYSNIYVIDTKNDRWAPGTPVRVRIDDERATVATASARSRSKVSGKLKKYGIRVPGRLRASFPLTEVNNSDGTSTTTARFQPNYPYGSRFAVHASTFKGRKSSECFVDDRPLGLVLEAQLDDGSRQVIYRDKSVPKSRGCPLGYAIGDIYDAPSGAKQAATMILMYVLKPGFEGKDARFLAIPVRLPGG